MLTVLYRFQVLEDVFHNLEQDGTMSVEDFFYGLFKNGKSLTSSASTPYRQLKRHLSMQVRSVGTVSLWEMVSLDQTARHFLIAISPEWLGG